MKIYIKAYCKKNLGDDLFVDILCKRYPKINFFLVCEEEYSFALRNIENLTIVNPSGLLFILRKLLLKILCFDIFDIFFAIYTDAVVMVGGSIFQQRGNWYKSYLSRRLTQYFTKSTFIIGANFGEYTTDLFIQKYSRYFENCTDVCFRDRQSYNLFNFLPNVRYSPDIVFSLEKKIVSHKEKIVAISVVNISEQSNRNLLQYKNVYIENMISIINFFHRQQYSIMLLSFCEYEGDFLIIEEIVKKTKYKIAVRQYNGQISEFVELLNKSSYIIATRFHAVVLALSYSIPLLPVIYNQKQTNLLNDINYKGEILNIADNKIIEIEEEMFITIDKKSLKLCKKKSLDHFLGIDQNILERIK